MKIPELFISLRDDGLLFDMDIEFAVFVCGVAEGTDINMDSLFSASVFASNSVLRNKDICLDLGKLAGKPFSEYFASVGDESEIEEHSAGLGNSFFPPLAKWTEDLKASGTTGKPGEDKIFILDEKKRFYLHKYWQYENSLAVKTVNRIRNSTAGPDQEIRRLLEKYFPPRGPLPDLQKLAAETALNSKFTLISGGPGTGKTTTASKILAMISEMNPGRNPSILLAAPTGKAASRLSESINRIKNSSAFPSEMKAHIPDKAHTVHRLLGVLPGKTGFLHNRENPLDTDTLVIDEASMISLPLMSKLMDAVPENSRVIMLGDKDQLSSVEAGSVLADFCDAMASGDDENIPGAAVVLTESMRFKDDDGIGLLASEVRKGNIAAALKILGENDHGAVSMLPLPPEDKLGKTVLDFMGGAYAEIMKAGSPAAALDIFSTFRILCARKKGTYGADGINLLIENTITGNGRGAFYHGRPVMILKNDYASGLFNGDIGIIWESGGALKAYFPCEDGMRTFIPGMLPPHESAFAMTIHKSQGSEFDSVLMIMPERESPLLTRELVYTGITRAKKKVILLGDEKTVGYAIGNRSSRNSGLKDALLREYHGRVSCLL